MEHFFTCPYCWEKISMILECSDEEETYVEDCEVCCRPIVLRYFCKSEVLSRFDACRIEGVS
jgi:hypothetical protein